MSDLPLPFWVVRQKREKAPPAHEPCDAPGHVIAFASAERLVAFLRARKDGRWSVQLIGDDHGLLTLIADFHFDRIPGLCVDPDEDGSGGKFLSVNELALQHGKRTDH